MIAKRIAIVVGEASGDILGSRLIKSLRELNPDLEFEGIGGPEMQAQGFKNLYEMERLSVMGIVEVLRRLPELMRIRKNLYKRWRDTPPDLMIGIDAPDFNLKLESRLHEVGVSVAHYVSPSVWAWRSGRVKAMRGNLDLMLTLFPFEAEFYEKENIPVAFVGHPLADDVPIESDKAEARKQLNLQKDVKILAILPGSRSSEIKYLAKAFVQSAQVLKQNYPDLQCIAPMANAKMHAKFRNIVEEQAPELGVIFIDGQSRLAMTASDWVLMASGTAVLEGMLVGRPMVAAGKMSVLTAAIIRISRTLKVTYFTLPNNLANESLVSELIQEDVTIENIVREVKSMMNMSEAEVNNLLGKFKIQHLRLRKNASENAARILAEKFSLS
ncbi:MAG: Lipid-A-disaccharide synthase (EC [uncultured Thiotrichaceae bacterium]|uniref:Lipid-A-disaccharide synthase n=1 Tax=uncultured Thiotrichaceae bacterium TaxID=298394 RepID=A0A6S6SE79_9GAMM|nr:MAG: Lipid-A-disaccharide synthase (EC [uncultured Thiotrichaceae bacterium]